MSRDIERLEEFATKLSNLMEAYDTELYVHDGEVWIMTESSSLRDYYAMSLGHQARHVSVIRRLDALLELHHEH